MELKVKYKTVRVKNRKSLGFRITARVTPDTKCTAHKRKKMIQWTSSK
jgi:hypothetical protein